MMLRSATLWIAAALACANPRLPPPETAVTFTCEAGAFASNMLAWALRSAADTATTPRSFRAEYGFTGASTGDWERQIAIVRDPLLCERAARVYAGNTPLRPGEHRVAMIAVGQRYVAVDLSAIKMAGEFMLEAVLDRDFRLIHMFGT